MSYYYYILLQGQKRDVFSSWVTWCCSGKCFISYRLFWFLITCILLPHSRLPAGAMQFKFAYNCHIRNNNLGGGGRGLRQYWSDLRMLTHIDSLFSAYESALLGQYCCRQHFLPQYLSLFTTAVHYCPQFSVSSLVSIWSIHWTASVLCKSALLTKVFHVLMRKSALLPLSFFI